MSTALLYHRAAGFLRVGAGEGVGGIMTELTQQQLNKVIESEIPMDRAWGSAVGIILIVDQSLHQFGTGPLFRVGEESFLVTAAHVVEEIGILIGANEIDIDAILVSLDKRPVTPSDSDATFTGIAA